jgi:hypothetical protein
MNKILDKPPSVEDLILTEEDNPLRNSGSK